MLVASLTLPYSHRGTSRAGSHRDGECPDLPTCCSIWLETNLEGPTDGYQAHCLIL